MDRIGKLVTFGMGGDTVYYGAGCTGSGYGSPERPHAAEGKAFPDGTPVIDKRPAVENGNGTRQAISGPMVNVDLEPGEVDACPEPSPIFATAMLQDSGNQYGSLLALQAGARVTEAQYGPLDSVDTATYVRLWREAGARIGQYIGGVIVWE